MFPATTNRPAVRMLLSIGVLTLVVAGCGAEEEKPAAETTTSTTTTTSIPATVVVTTEPQVETPSQPTEEDLQQLEEEIRGDVIAFELAYWEFLSTGDVTLVQPFVDEGLYEGYVANVVPDLEENGLFLEGFSLEVDVPSIEITDDLGAALVSFCYVSDQDLAQVNEAGEETTAVLANEPYGVTMRVERGEDGVWKATFGTPRPVIGEQYEDTCAKFLGG